MRLSVSTNKVRSQFLLPYVHARAVMGMHAPTSRISCNFPHFYCSRNMRETTWDRIGVTPLLPSILHQQVRTLIKFGVRKGKRKTVKPVIHRFLRLHCGLWLRRRAGYKKRLWKKNYRRRRRLRQHVFCNKTQSKLLDKMTSSFWKRRNWYIDDPYQKYHDRTNLKL
uniref:Large ribosomal subunit protein bL35m n=1 Tax=Podarcis muralis TaxID=64176 RepID=A0A670J7Y1_PODMU